LIGIEIAGNDRFPKSHDYDIFLLFEPSMTSLQDWDQQRPERLPTLAGIEEARELLLPYQPETPLVRCDLLSQDLGADVWLKNETVSSVASFKLRGALVEILRVRAEREVSGVVTSSSGNHGQGVAQAARILGLEADVFLARDSNPLKRAKIAALGASIHEVGKDLDEAKSAARDFAASRPELAFVDDGEGLGVMEGAGTVGLEVARALPALDDFLVPMGSGSLAGGCGVAIKAVHPGARVIAVQSAGSPAMVESFHARRPVSRPIDTIADGLVCREPAALALAALLASVDEALLTDDATLLEAVRALALRAHILVEPSGAAALAGAWGVRDQLAGRTVVLVLTGSNITPEQLSAALQ
jgi:threonine dehydratase